MYYELFSIIDVVIVLTVILFLVLGWKKGFLEKVIDMASSIFGLIASILLARPFSNVLRGWFGESLESNISEYLMSRSSEFASELTRPNLISALEGLSLPDFMVEWIADSVDYNQITVSIIDSITPLILTLALLFIAFITLFFGSMIVFFLLRLLARGITSIPIIKHVDKFLGLLFGLLKVALLISILLFVLGLVINIPAINNLIYEWLNNDMQLSTEKFRLSKYLYDNNLLKNIINVFVTII
ncbi:CvpA family protein [Candidatus Izemoplasma sp. B36]|uniref:CvpA family protein n=1 Tax=Candidatus Izemoplasma sp. B36 TaxID=3242468 RepID=UPI003556940F